MDYVFKTKASRHQKENCRLPYSLNQIIYLWSNFFDCMLTLGAFQTHRAQWTWWCSLTLDFQADPDAGPSRSWEWTRPYVCSLHKRVCFQPQWRLWPRHPLPWLTASLVGSNTPWSRGRTPPSWPQPRCWGEATECGAEASVRPTSARPRRIWTPEWSGRCTVPGSEAWLRWYRSPSSGCPCTRTCHRPVRLTSETGSEFSERIDIRMP